VLGGGAGMSAAHELAERGFLVDVYERQPTYVGGKARSVNVSADRLLQLLTVPPKGQADGAKLAAPALPPAQAELTDVLRDLASNQARIVQHGGRDAGIVRGMLEHSRASTGERAPTDVNALADEYLRLAYHGLRAKDKTFNATLQTDLAPYPPLRR